MFLCQLISIVTCNFQINKARNNWQKLKLILFSIWRDWFVIFIGIVILTVYYWSEKISNLCHHWGLWVPMQLLILMRIFLEIEKIFEGGPIQYLKSMKNWMQILNFTMIFFIIWLPSNICNIKRQLAAFVLVFSWTDFAVTLLKVALIYFHTLRK